MAAMVIGRMEKERKKRELQYSLEGEEGQERSRLHLDGRIGKGPRKAQFTKKMKAATEYGG
jgi:hypothetical protein